MNEGERKFSSRRKIPCKQTECNRCPVKNVSCCRAVFVIDRLIFYSRKAWSREGRGETSRELDHKRVGVYGHRIVHPFLEKSRRRNRPIWPFVRFWPDKSEKRVPHTFRVHAWKRAPYYRPSRQLVTPTMTLLPVRTSSQRMNEYVCWI